MDKNIISLKNKINEDNNDTAGTNPIKIVKSILDQVEEITNGIVLAKINRYSKNIKEMSSMFNINTIDLGDVQKKLGDIGDSGKITYELYITSSVLEKYKYRFAFIEFDLSGYPMEYVIDDDIANEIKIDDHAMINDDNNLERLIYTVINSDKMVDVIRKLYKFSE